MWILERNPLRGTLLDINKNALLLWESLPFILIFHNELWDFFFFDTWENEFKQFFFLFLFLKPRCVFRAQTLPLSFPVTCARDTGAAGDLRPSLRSCRPRTGHGSHTLCCSAGLKPEAVAPGQPASVHGAAHTGTRPRTAPQRWPGGPLC